MVPIFELKRQYAQLKPQMDRAVTTVMERGMFTLGEEVRAFEAEFEDYLNIYHAVGVGSGTDALGLAIKALGIGPGDEVILPANSYPSAFGVALTGVSIRLADCGPDGNLDLESLDTVLSKKTKAVLVVHLYGNPADVIGIKNLLRKRKLSPYIIEDAAQAHGARLKDGSAWRKVGTIGEIGCFSFYPTKNLGAYGDGGMVVTDKSSLATRLKALRMYGETSRYISETVSGVSRLDELQAAVLRVKLPYLDEWNDKRAANDGFYERELAGVGDIRFVKSAKEESCHHLCVIRTAKRDALQKYLTENGVGCAVHYPVPIHLTKSFVPLGYKKGDFPEAEAQCREVLSIPVYPDLTSEERETVAATIKKFFRG